MGSTQHLVCVSLIFQEIFFKRQAIVMSSGTVKFFNGEKGSGFITPDSGADLFFHISEVKGTQPRDGDKVEFEVGQGKKVLAQSM